MAWTDERIDDAAGRFDHKFDELRDEMREMRAEMRDGFRDLRGEIAANQRQMTAIGWTIAAGLLAQLIAFVIAVAITQS